MILLATLKEVGPIKVKDMKKWDHNFTTVPHNSLHPQPNLAGYISNSCG